MKSNPWGNSESVFRPSGYGRASCPPDFRTILHGISLLILLSVPVLVAAQPILSHVSTATRSDGLGYVIRLHLNSPADSFKVIQPNTTLIQLALYKDGIESSGIGTPQLELPFTGYDTHRIPHGLGVDIHLAEGFYYIARAYPDVNGRHLLVGMTRASARDLSVLTEGMTPVDWVYLNRPRTAAADTSALALAQDADSLSTAGYAPADSVGIPADSIPVHLSITMPVVPPVNGRSMKLQTVVIDAGHGGHDPGAVSTRGVKEKDIVLKVGLKLGKLIEEQLPDVKVVYTRTRDNFVELEERGSIANQAKGDLFISLHTNSHKTRQPNGAEFYFLGLHKSNDALEVMKRENSVILLENPETRSRELTEEELILYELTNTAYIASSQYFAELLDRQFTERARRRSRGVKQAGLIVLFHASMPSILAELGFISNPEEERFMTSESGQNILASAIFRAVREYKEHYERSPVTQKN